MAICATAALKYHIVWDPRLGIIGWGSGIALFGAHAQVSLFGVHPQVSHFLGPRSGIIAWGARSGISLFGAHAQVSLFGVHAQVSYCLGPTLPIRSHFGSSNFSATNIADDGHRPMHFISSKPRGMTATTRVLILNN